MDKTRIIEPHDWGLYVKKNFSHLDEVQQKESQFNRSPKGNMWSAIPVALLWVIANWSEGKQGSGPKGDEVL